MPSFSFLEVDPPAGSEPRRIERTYRMASCPEEVDVDGVVYALDRSDFAQDRPSERVDPLVRPVGSLPARSFQGDSFSSVQFAPGEGRQWLDKVPRSERWSYDADGVPVFTSQAQHRAFTAASEGKWKWDRDCR